jgi:myo-inositol-1(or 4)-monophosphatase
LPAPEASDLDLIVAAVREAGELALKLAVEGVRTWEKSPGNPVCEADLELDALLARRLRSARPDYGWLSEEAAADGSHLRRPRAFLVDSIDGTRDYIRGRDGWAVSVAVIEAGAPIAGALFAPARDQFYVAERGKGARLQGTELNVGEVATLEGARMPVDPSQLKSKLWRGNPPAATAVEKPNSIALRIAKIASADADAVFVARPVRLLDIAAAALILTEAGGLITDHRGEPPRFGEPPPKMPSLVAAVPEVHASLRARLASALRG